MDGDVAGIGFEDATGDNRRIQHRTQPHGLCWAHLAHCRDHGAVLHQALEPGFLLCRGGDEQHRTGMHQRYVTETGRRMLDKAAAGDCQAPHHRIAVTLGEQCRRAPRRVMSAGLLRLEEGDFA